MKPLYFEYHLTPADYRTMTYFNSFSLKRFQGIAVCAAWAGSFCFLMLELLGVVELTRITHICCLVVSVCVPVLVLNLEYAIHKFKSGYCGPNAAQRKMIITEEGVRYAADDEEQSHLEPWTDFMRVFELNTQFLFYKDARRTTILPKSAISAEALETLRALMREKLGGYYICRCHKTA